MPVENSPPTATLASVTPPSDVAEPSHHVSTPQSPPSTTDVPKAYFRNTFPKNGDCNNETRDENKETEGQPNTACSAATLQSRPTTRIRPASIEELLTPQESTRSEQSVFYLNSQATEDDSASTIHAGLHPGAKKRQRGFTRTKTGCLTCRKRKKKCDETKPICVYCC